MSAARKFCEALPILLTQAQGLQQTAGSLSASSELTTAQDLVVSMKVFNLIGGTSVPILSREAKVNEQGLWDSGSLAAAAFTKFAEVQQTLLSILGGKGMLVPDQSQQTQPTVAETLRAIDTLANSNAMELLQNQPGFVHINSSQDAAKAEGDYAKLTATMKSFADTLAGKLKEVWMQKYIELLRPALEEMATLLDNLGAYLQQATSSELTGNCINQQREILEASLNHTIQTCR